MTRDRRGSYDSAMHGGLFAGIRVKAGVRVAFVALPVAVGGSILVGFVAKALQGPVDDPVFDSIERASTNGWTDLLETFTTMGNVPQTQRLAVVLAALLAAWFALRGWRWWMPLLVLPAAWIVSRLAQLGMAAIVDREREVLSLIGTEIGAFPSGGVARIVIVTGTAAFLVVHYARPGRAVVRGMVVVVALLGLAEGYFRTRLNQHWFTDVVGGEVYGWLMLWAVVVTLRAFDPEPAAHGRARPAGETSHQPSTVG